jgi:V8-like Glu-specific endopeptidase
MSGRRRTVLVAPMAWAAAWAAACAPPPVGSERAAIVGGSLDPGDGAVVALLDRRTRCEQTNVRIVCTGTLIAPRVVLTAAHCLDEQGALGTWEVYVGTPVGGDAQGGFVVVTDTAVHPAWNRTTHEFDLALLRLSDAAPVAPVPFAAAPLPASLVGATVRVVGYGAMAPAALTDGQRRQTTMTVSALDANVFRAVPAPGNSCEGDSGGPAFGDVGAGEQILGVTVSGDLACSTYALQARVDGAVADFIQPFVDATALAPVGRPLGRIDAGALCQTACADASDCPAALTCEPATPDRAAVCALSQAAPANFGAVCAHDSDCGSGGSCARLWPDGADACRCSQPCGSAPPPHPGGGCSMAPLSSERASWALALAGLLTLALLTVVRKYATSKLR